MSYCYESYLMHHGIKGQKWGVRRFQNPDGSLTAEGKERYGYKVVDKKEAIELCKQYYNTKISLNPFAKSKSPDSHDNRIVNNAIKMIKDSSEEESQLVNELQSRLNKNVQKHFDDPETIKNFKEYMKDELVSPKMVDDPDVAWLAIHEFVDDEAVRVAFGDKEFKKMHAEWSKVKEQRNNAVSKYIEDTLGKYGKQPIAKDLVIRPSILGGVGMSYTKSTLKEGVKKDVNNALASIDNKSLIYYDDDLITKYTKIWEHM